MKDGCIGDGTCGRKERGECDCGDEHSHDHGNKIDIKSLGPEAMELAQMFEEINSHLIAALKARKKILETLHMRAAQSDAMKGRMDKVLSAQHPVLIQFVFENQE
jgi:hypothetical protein